MRWIIPLLLLFVGVGAVCDINNVCDYDTVSNLTFYVYNSTYFPLKVPLENANCTISILDTNNSHVVTDSSTLELGVGRYYYTLSQNETDQIGVYKVRYNCTYGSYETVYDSMYEIMYTTPSAYFESINSTTTYVYLQTTDIWTWIANSTSILYQNILNYLQGQLETTLSQDATEQVAQATWNDTIVPDRESKDAPTPTWRGWGQGWG